MLEGLRILLVDADEDTVEVYGAILGNEGADCRSATKGATALETIQDGWFPDAVLTHLRLPDMMGRDLVEAVTGRARSPVALLCTTSDARPQAQVAARAAGFSVCLVKPIGLDHLCAAILEAVRAAPRAAR
jgi:two-component system sensor histidine kinase EvgS